MRILPFPCTRPLPEHAAASTAYCPDPAALRERLLGDTYVADANRSIYLYEQSDASACATGIVAICPVAELSGAKLPVSGDAVMQRISVMQQLGYQPEPVMFGYEQSPVLNTIIDAAKTSSPLFSLVDASGTTHTVWEIVRTEAVEAICSMIDAQGAHMVDGADQAAAVSTYESVKTVTDSDEGTYTGKEPYHFTLCALFPLEAARACADRFLGGLFYHRIAR